MSGSRGPISKPNAVRRNLKAAKMQLPSEGYQGPIPDWPLPEGNAFELDRWERVWRTPMAAAWIRMGIETVVARYVRIAIIAESYEGTTSVALSNIKAEARQLETMLGLNPAALKRLEWEIASDEVEELREAAPRRRKLKAVDPEAESG